MKPIGDHNGAIVPRAGSARCQPATDESRLQASASSLKSSISPKTPTAPNGSCEGRSGESLSFRGVPGFAAAATADDARIVPPPPRRPLETISVKGISPRSGPESSQTVQPGSPRLSQSAPSSVTFVPRIDRFLRPLSALRRSRLASVMQVSRRPSDWRLGISGRCSKPASPIEVMSSVSLSRLCMSARQASPAPVMPGVSNRRSSSSWRSPAKCSRSASVMPVPDRLSSRSRVSRRSCAKIRVAERCRGAV